MNRNIAVQPEALQGKTAKPQSTWFPPVDSVAAARRVDRQGMIASLFIAAVTTAFAIASTKNALPSNFNRDLFNPMLFVDALLYGAIAWGIHRLSRIAAIAGLSLYLFSRILLYVSGMPTNSVGMAITTIISIAFINAIRATFAYHHFQRQLASNLPYEKQELPELN
ncbi:MAG: hypothetical protein Fur0046_00750 [Cyanobacteria bacterium J069]|nr:MAG: hypothetical protein D6742_03640 [Cyanobacteria bacterium J069]